MAKISTLDFNWLAVEMVWLTLILTKPSVTMRATFIPFAVYPYAGLKRMESVTMRQLSISVAVPAGIDALEFPRFCTTGIKFAAEGYWLNKTETWAKLENVTTPI